MKIDKTQLIKVELRLATMPNVQLCPVMVKRSKGEYKEMEGDELIMMALIDGLFRAREYTPVYCPMIDQDISLGKYYGSYHINLKDSYDPIIVNGKPSDGYEIGLLNDYEN